MAPLSVHERIRTSDPSLRRRVLYPAELRRRVITKEYHIFLVIGIKFLLTQTHSLVI